MYTTGTLDGAAPTTLSVVTAPSLTAIKLTLLRIIVLLGISVYTIDWINNAMRQNLLPLDTIIYPILLLLSVGVAIVLFIRPIYGSELDKLGLIVLLSYGAAYIYAILYVWPQQNILYRFSATPEWLPLIYTIALFVFELRKGLIISLILYLSLLLAGGIYLLSTGTAGFSTLVFQMLLHIYVWSLIYIPLLSGIALLRERYIKTAAFAKMMSQAAHIDDLTKTYNRRCLGITLRQTIEQAQRYNHTLSMIILDIDCFKQVNDTFGHDGGDLVLTEMAVAVGDQLRTVDTFGRWGGEEFMIMMPETSLEQALVLAERLRTSIAQQVHGRVGQITASFGVSTYRLGDTAETLVKRADTALYQAKLNGRNCVIAERMHGDGMHRCHP